MLDFIAAALFVDREAGTEAGARHRSAASRESERPSKSSVQQRHSSATERARHKVKQGKFFIFLFVLLAIATGYYFYSTDRSSDTVLIGIVDANQVIVSSKIAGRVEKLNVDEGSRLKPAT